MSGLHLRFPIAKTEAWQETCSSLSPKTNRRRLALPSHQKLTLKSPLFYPWLFFFFIFLFSNFPNCSSSRESASVFADYLRFHFYISQPKALHSRTRGYLSELRQATCHKESHSSFCSPFSDAKLLAAATNLSLSSATGPDKVAYLMLKHLFRSGMDFLLRISNLSWSFHSFPTIWKTLYIIPVQKMGSLSTLLLPSGLSLTSCISKLFERIILSRDQILFLVQSISDGFNKPSPGSRTILATINFSKVFDSVWHPPLFHKLISAGLPPCFARWTQSFFSDRRA